MRKAGLPHSLVREPTLSRARKVCTTWAIIAQLGAGVIEQESVRQSACFVNCTALALLTSRPNYGTVRDNVPVMTGRLLRRVLSYRFRGNRIADPSLAASCYPVVVVSTAVNEKNSSNLTWPCLTSVILCVPRNPTSVQRSSTACLPEIAMHMRKRHSTCSRAHPVCRAAQTMHVRSVECLLAAGDGDQKALVSRARLHFPCAS
jgi:hypothetical protein